ncbi:MAG: hypothetical protein Phog2KO_32210 [Phototrophicaceae bacterium]
MQFLAQTWSSQRLRLSLIAGIFTALLVLGLWWGNIFMSVRLRLNDVHFAPAPTSDNIVIIALDDATLLRYGTTPSEWSRTAYIDLINTLMDASPRVIAFDLLFSEVEVNDGEFAQALNNIRQSDARTRIVLGDAGINNIPRQSDTPLGYNVYTFQDDLPISSALAQNADYLGYTNTLPDIDSIVRRQPSIILADNTIYYSFSLATYLAYLRIPNTLAEKVVLPVSDGLSVTDNIIPVDEFGFWQLYYYGQPATDSVQTFPIVPFVDVVDNTVDLSIFEDKIVLVGLINNTGLLDQYLAPSSISGNLMAGVEIQANSIESIIQSQFPRPLAPFWQGMLIIFFTMLASMLYALPRWYFKLILLLILLTLGFLISSFVFSTSFVMISPFDLLLATVLPFLFSLGIDITIESNQRQQKEFLLKSLQHIAEQQLQLDQAAIYILDDIKQLVPEANSLLYLYDETQAQGYAVFEQQKASSLDQNQKLLIPEQYKNLRHKLVIEEKTIVPFVWREKTRGLLVIPHIGKRNLGTNTEKLIQELVTQLAPNIDNMVLHTEVGRQKLLLDAVFAESPAGIVVIDNTGVIVQYNDDLSAFLSSGNINLNGQSLPELLSINSETENLLTTLMNGLDSKKMFAVDDVKLGEGVVRLDAAPLPTYDLWTVIIGDLTTVAELSELKTQMLRIAAHDLKNPLARIMGFTELLEMQLDLDERQGRYLGFILKASKDMLDIINDILNLERLRSGKLLLKEIDFSTLIREVCESHQPDVIQKQQIFDLQMPENIVYANADVGQLSQAVTNIVGNAIKYTPNEGKITVRLEQNEDSIRFEVQDTGYGIPKEAQEKMFTEFYRAKSEATSHISGTGLGLSLVKSVIEAHGGEIDFISEEGVGSTFFFTLPATKAGS